MLTALMMSNFHSDQHTFFVGGRWDLRENLALKAQVDLIRGESTSLFPYRQVTTNWDGSTNFDGHMTVYSLALDFVF